MAHDTIRQVQSERSFSDTVSALEDVLKKKGLTIMAKIDHAAGARSVDLELRPTTLFIFGNPRAGTPIMKVNQLVGLDLPMKILVSEDEAGAVHLTYRAPESLVSEWELSPPPPPIAKMVDALSAISNAAAGK